MSDRWAPPISILSLRGGIPLWVNRANWAWAASWPGPVGSPAALFLFLSQINFSLFHLKKNWFGFAIKLANFEILQMCKIL
jgi:hypothetical protein